MENSVECLLGKFLKIHFITFNYVYECACVLCSLVRVPDDRSQKRVLDPPELELQATVTFQHGYQELNSGPPQEQTVLLTTAPSVQLLAGHLISLLAKYLSKSFASYL